MKIIVELKIISANIFIDGLFNLSHIKFVLNVNFSQTIFQRTIEINCKSQSFIVNS